MTTVFENGTYEQAIARIDGSETLSQYKDIITSDWSNTDDHYNWVLTAPETEIAQWAQDIKRDQE